MLQSLHKKSRNSPHLKFRAARVVEVCVLEDAEQDKYIQSLSQRGLGSLNDNTKGIVESAELSFRRHITGRKANNVTISIPVGKIPDDILMQPVVLSLWDNITSGLDFSISSECRKLVLENFVKLLVRVSTFLYAKNTMSQHKL